MKRDIGGKFFHREITLRAEGTDGAYVASFSSNNPVKRWFGNEILSHDSEAVDLSRVVDGNMPLLYQHDTDVLIGYASDFSLSNNRLSGTIRFSENGRGPEVRAQVDEGMPFGISIGYRVDEWSERADSEDVTVTRWTLYEVSVVTVPADVSVGINRSIEMENEDKGGSQPPANASDAAAANVRLVSVKAKQEAIAEERQRIARIRELFTQPGFQSDECLELERMAIDGGLTLDQTREQLLLLVGSGITPIVAPPVQTFNIPGPSESRSFVNRQSSIRAGEDKMDKFRSAAAMAIEYRAGMLKTKDEMAAARNGNHLVGYTLSELARECLVMNNINVNGLDRMRMVGMAFTNGFSLQSRSTAIIGMGLSDFANLLIDASNKSMLMGFKEADETYQTWTRAINISDFKTNNLVNLSLFGDLDVVAEHAEYKYGKFSDIKETIALRTYGKLFSISRQAIINDDLNAFTAIPNRMGRAARRMVGDEVYAVLTSNPTMVQDSTALFHTNHGNIYTTTGAGAPSVATLDTMFTGMATRTDPSGNTLNLVPKYLIVPRALENTARVLAAAQYNPAGTAGTLPPNPFQGRIEVVADARLDADSAAEWYMACDPNACDTVIVGYLNGQQEPYLEQQESFTQDGIAMKVRLDCRAVAGDFRGLAYNDGVA